MGFGEWFGVVGGIISIIAFIFSVWVWMRSDIKVREMLGVIQAAHDLSGSIAWEMTKIPGEDMSVRLRHAESSLGLASAIRTITSKYVRNGGSHRQAELGGLLDRGVIWGNAMMWDLERSDRIKEVWLVTPDLEPDLSDPDVGDLVNKNIKKGTRYTYFFPADLGDLDELRAKLFANLKLDRSSRGQAAISFVTFDLTSESRLFRLGNVILLFEGDPATSNMYALEEVVLTKVSERGAFWQEHPRSVAENLRRTLTSVRAKSMLRKGQVDGADGVGSSDS